MRGAGAIVRALTPLVGLVAFAVHVARFAGPEYVLDDAWITFRVARNGLEHGVLSYDVDLPVEGATNLSWTLASLIWIAFAPAHDPIGPARDYGLGNYGDVLHPARSRGHDGGLPGFLSTYRYFPEHAFGYVLLLNATHSTRAWVEIRMLLFAYLAQGRTPPQPPRVDTPREALIDHVGHWTFASPRHSILAFLDTLLLQADVELEGDQLHLRLRSLGIVLPLLPTGPNRFRLPSQSGTSVQFASDHTGKPVMTVHNLYFERGSLVFARVREHGLRIAWLLLQSAVVSFLVLLLLHAMAHLRRATGFGPELRLLAPFVVATGSLVGAVLLVLGSDFAELGTPNLRTAGICVLPLVFASASLAGVARTALALVAPHPRPPRLWVRLHAATVSLGALVLSGYLAWHHLIGLRTWAW